MQHYALKTQTFANRSFLTQSLSVLVGSLIIAAAAQIQIPLWPVPVTLQTFAVLFISMSLGWRLGLVTVLAYLFEGACGLPVFAQFSAGLMVLTGPSAGYLLAFPLAAILAGALVQHRVAKNFIGIMLTALVAFAFILAIGMTYLSLFTGWKAAYVLGMQPFLLGELLKAIMLAVIVPTLINKAKS